MRSCSGSAVTPEPMHAARKVLRSLQFGLYERLVDDHRGNDARQLTSLACFYALSHIGSSFAACKSMPTEMHSIRENDLDCFASTGVNMPA